MDEPSLSLEDENNFFILLRQQTVYGTTNLTIEYHFHTHKQE